MIEYAITYVGHGGGDVRRARGALQHQEEHLRHVRRRNTNINIHTNNNDNDPDIISTMKHYIIVYFCILEHSIA